MLGLPILLALPWDVISRDPGAPRGGREALRAQRRRHSSAGVHAACSGSAGGLGAVSRARWLPAPRCILFPRHLPRARTPVPMDVPICTPRAPLPGG